MNAITQVKGCQPLAGMTKKVFECTPAKEAQQIHQIITELKVRKACSADKAAVVACLDDLIDLGLVVGVGADRYQRTPIQAKHPTENHLTAVVPVDVRPEVESVPDALARLAGEMRDCASHFASRYKTIAERLDAVAARAAKDGEEESEAVAKLRQLQSLLKGL